jgi:hypothetical protein
MHAQPVKRFYSRARAGTNSGSRALSAMATIGFFLLANDLRRPIG